MPSTTEIMVVGHLDIDRIRTDRTDRRDVLGGSAFYTAFGAGIASESVHLVSTICPDYPVQRLRATIPDEVKLKGVLPVLGQQRRNDMDYSEESTIESTSDRISRNQSTDAWHRRSTVQAPRHRPIHPDRIQHVHLSPMFPRYQRLYAEWANSHNIPVSLDTSRYYASNYSDELRGVIELTDIFLPSDSEIVQLYPKFSERTQYVLRELVMQGPAVVVIRQGENGCIAYERGSRSAFSFSTLSTEVTDPTGAGDSFNGGFISLYRENDLIDSCQYGIGVATRCIEGVGVEELGNVTNAELEVLAEGVSYDSIED